MGTVRVKICGITSLDDGLRAIEAGADALGFNFYKQSPRSVPLAKAAKIIAQLPPLISTVSVWVDPSEAQLRESLGACRWSAIQLSGDEPDELALSFPRDLVIRAARLKDAKALTTVKNKPRCAAWLVDASVKGEYGGTGKLARWDLAAKLARRSTVILAGGLTAANVAEAVKKVKPYGVDTASGVEKAPGKKDLKKMIAFVRAAKAAGE
jgi:phosphoribosylanthranilate isomerase